MGKELYVGHLSFETTEYELEKLFSVSGRVTSIHLITDSVTGEFKGCGYVRMSTDAEAKDAIDSLDGALLIGRKITVSEARPQKMKPQGGGYKGKSSGAKAGAGKDAAGKPGGFKAGAAKTGAPKAGGPKAGGAAAAKPKTGKR